jgi:hypothetical protein
MLNIAKEAFVWCSKKEKKKKQENQLKESPKEASPN